MVFSARAFNGKATKVVRILHREGPRALTQRLARYAYTKFDTNRLDEPLHDGDVADSTQLALALPEQRPPRSQPLRVGWVMTPPSGGSGGHTTLFRMVEAAEQSGHDCVLFLYDRYGGDLNAHARIIHRWWPNLNADIRDAADGISEVDACVASSWESAHVLARHGTSAMRRLYFIQDYEPYFYAHGSTYSLAVDSYRFGFRCIALGEMVAQLIRNEIGISPDITEFGCDTSTYRLLPHRDRTGVAFFARPDSPRRGYWLARLALQQFHSLHPDLDIHVYGSTVLDLPFPAIQHGKLTPTELNELYNSCIAGLALSFTNISLVPEEMLAAGTIPVMNDLTGSRSVLRNDFAVWATPTPHALASALSAAVTRADRVELARAAAESVRQFGWTRAQNDVVRIIEGEVYGVALIEPGTELVP